MATAIALLAFTGVTATVPTNDFANSVPEEAVEKPKLSQLIRGIQQDLADLGYKPGPIDGIMGARTERAIRQFQRDNQLPITSQPLDSLGAVGQLASTLQKYKESKTARRRKVTGKTDDQLQLSLIVFGTVIAAVVAIGFVTRTRNRRSYHQTTVSERKQPDEAERVEPVIDDDTVVVATSADRKQHYQTATVQHVIDGDTVIVATFWQEIRIRLASIDCPEGDQDWGDIAKYGLIKLIGGRKIFFEEHCQDQYGRTVATIYVQSDDEAELMNVNARMVTLGHAWVRRDFDGNLSKERQDELYRLQRWARTKKVGLWNSANPVPPWKWRGPK
jgi:endonuclease YncB( thermonuclease family)